MKIKRLLNIGISAALVLSAHMGVAASNFINLEQMIQTHSEDELIRNEDGQVIGVDITNDEEEDSTEIVDFQTLIHLPQWKEYEKFDVTCDEEKQKVFFKDMCVTSLSDNYSLDKILLYDSWESLIDQETEEYDFSEGIALIAERDEKGVLQYFTFLTTSVK